MGGSGMEKSTKTFSWGKAESHVKGNVLVTVVPALSDNYMYLLGDLDKKVAAVVDPVEPEKLLEVAKQENIEIQMVLTTHNHWDHAGGNNKIAQLIPGVKIYGGINDNAQGVTKEVGEGDHISVGGLHVDVLSTPCHTPGHVCYVVHPAAQPTLAFTGDTLFVAGCGNFNNGTPELMHGNFRKLGNLPLDTLLFVGHEYTTSNLQYASFVEPQNAAVANKLKWSQDCQAKGVFTVPSCVQEERDTNPFLRAVLGLPLILQHCGTNDTVAAIKYVREEKTNGAWKQHLAKA
eukprot:c15153_g1_i1.p1 GENE.c15153_g1_i1~~c15153_g1_i1.p1  ORF type:complete len:290 (-),score=63.37 c15153_g1_i1:121-990(-)